MEIIVGILKMITLSGILVGIHFCITHHENSFVYSSSSTLDLAWWQTTIIYQIYTRSFQDTNGDGIGDLKGITSRLDYLQYLNVETICLSPFYESPMVDQGYDVSNHTAVDPIYGTMEDFEDLLKAVHERGMKLILDYIPSYTSDQHPWFQASRKGDCNYADYYVWHEGKLLENGTRVPPNNWESLYAQSAWTWDSGRQEYYLHQHAVEEPDLDYRNANVIVDMMAVFKFWLNKGVDGFQIDSVQTLVEVQNFLDEPRSNKPGVKQFEPDYLWHIYTQNQPEIHDVIGIWREKFDKYKAETGKHVFMAPGVYDETLLHSMKYYESGSDMPFNLLLTKIDSACDAECFYKHINNWLENIPKGRWPNFVTGNHNCQRISNRKGSEYVDVLNIMLLTLPGTPATYQGEELGLMNINISYKDAQDPLGRNIGEKLFEKYSRDPCRAPMQWDDSINAGFSKAEKTWLPVNPDYITRNVQAQRNNPSGNSHLQIYKKAAKLRQKPSFWNPNIEYIVFNKDILSFIRRTDGNPAYLIALNLGNSESTDNYESKLKEFGLSGKGQIVLKTANMTGYTEQNDGVVGLGSITLSPGDGIIVLLDEKGKEGNKTELDYESHRNEL